MRQFAVVPLRRFAVLFAALTCAVSLFLSVASARGLSHERLLTRTELEQTFGGFQPVPDKACTWSGCYYSGSCQMYDFPNCPGMYATAESFSSFSCDTTDIGNQCDLRDVNACTFIYDCVNDEDNEVCKRDFLYGWESYTGCY